MFNSLLVYFLGDRLEICLPQEVLVTLPQIPVMATEGSIPLRGLREPAPCLSHPLSLPFPPPHAFWLLFGISEPRGLPSLPERKKRKEQDANEMDQLVD